MQATESNPQPEYFRLLKEAEQTSDEADNFNLNFNSPTSREKYAELCEASEKAQHALITYVHKNFDQLAASMDLKLESEEEETEEEEEEDDG